MSVGEPTPDDQKHAAFHASAPGVVLACKVNHALNERIAGINYSLPCVQ
jgi:hypothetical protein